MEPACWNNMKNSNAINHVNELNHIFFMRKVDIGMFWAFNLSLMASVLTFLKITFGSNNANMVKNAAVPHKKKR
jgi:hypothetical protein